MPLSALTLSHPDHIARLSEIPGLLTRFAEEASVTSREPGAPAPRDDVPAGKELSEFTCPDCGGSLWVVSDEPLHFRCRVGHAYSSQSLEVGKQDALEAAIWAAIVALDERADLAERMLRRMRGERSRRRYVEQIEQGRRGAATLRRLVAELVASPEPVAGEGDGRDDGED